MQTYINISSEILDWITTHIQINTLHPEIADCLKSWISGQKNPTFNQIEKVSKATGIPLGYFFLQHPPNEDLSFVEYRVGVVVSLSGWRCTRLRGWRLGRLNRGARALHRRVVVAVAACRGAARCGTSAASVHAWPIIRRLPIRAAQGTRIESPLVAHTKSVARRVPPSPPSTVPRRLLCSSSAHARPSPFRLTPSRRSSAPLRSLPSPLLRPNS